MATAAEQMIAQMQAQQQQIAELTAAAATQRDNTNALIAQLQTQNQSLLDMVQAQSSQQRQPREEDDTKHLNKVKEFDGDRLKWP